MSRTDARELMVEAAERLMAERGIEAVSLREVGAAAGQRNNSAAQYHFGTKDGLVSAVIDRRSAPVEQARARMIEELGDREPSVRELLEIFVTPLVETLREPSHYLRFLHQVMLARAADSRRLESQQPGVRFMNEGLHRHSPEISPARFLRRSTWIAQMTLQVLADVERTGTPQHLDDITHDLLTALEALATAPAQ